MFKLNYKFKTVAPFHTGSDISAGTLKSLRRQICITSPITIKTQLSEEDRRNAVVAIHYGVWQAIDKTVIKGKRLMGIWEEFYNKIVAAARSQNKYQYFENLCRSWGIQAVRDTQTLEALEAISDYELLHCVREETMYIALKVRGIKTRNKAEGVEYNIFTRPKEKVQEETIISTRSEIPCISGNTFRGKLRRYVMHDFFKLIDVNKIDKRVYHTLFSGGFLDQKTNWEDIDKINSFIMNCPMIGLFGSAIGNMTIEGDLQMGWAYPLCSERGTGTTSYWESIDTIFQTKSDSSKIEKEISFYDESEKEQITQQMKYEYEAFAVGTEFEHRIACTSSNPLIVSAFWRMIKLFKEKPFIGGMASVGNGELDLSELKMAGDDDVYMQHIAENKQSIKEFWENVKI